MAQYDAGLDTMSPIGAELPEWRPRPHPIRAPFLGRYCRLEPLGPERHAEALFEANSEDADGSGWTYLPYGPFATRLAYRRWVAAAATTDDPLFFAILLRGGGDVDGRSGYRADVPVGVASYLRITPEVGSIEVGHIRFAPRLQRTRAATEAMYLMMRRVFDELGYRRYEWKCDALNEASRRAAERLGFTYEGTFRQATIYKGRNRDTAWYSVIDADWPTLRAGFEAWLAPENFDGEGRQVKKLEVLRAGGGT